MNELIICKSSRRSLSILLAIALCFSLIPLHSISLAEGYSQMNAQASTTCEFPAWNANEVYVGGDKVAHDGHEWQAKWWTQGEEPGTTGQWGVWEDLGPCEEGNEPDPDPSGPPEVPQNLQATAGNEQVSLSWSASDGADSYRVKRSTKSGGSYSTIATVTTTSYMDLHVTNGTTYYYVVSALNDEGESSDSSEVSVTPEEGHTDPDEACKPEGLWSSGVANIPYCDVYDEDGREKLANNLDRRIIGYFASWRTGKGDESRYLVPDIPWDKLSHINYAFAHVDSNNEISVGSADNPNNPTLGMTWPEYEDVTMDPTLPYKGHFNLIQQYKEDHPDVKFLVAVGGWAESGGYFDDTGERVASGGFYSMTTHEDGSVNYDGIETFANSVVDFIREYNLDGIDIDYEYPTSMENAGNPLDWEFSTPRLSGLNKSYDVLMRTLREKLDEASAEDGKYYLLTIASPSSGYLLRGMETLNPLQYLDFVNVMSYDLHGAWNQYVGPNAALYDDGQDAELVADNVYDIEQFGGIGYLNTDWAFHYYRGAMEAGRINIGVPYYTRGWQNVSGGTNGLWGTAPSTDCPTGLTQCGDGATGIDNIWHDKDEDGSEIGSGVNPMWHAKNLEHGIFGSYLQERGFSPADMVGSYTRYYDSTLVAPWLWNEETNVFLSTEDVQSLQEKAEWVIDKGVGGIMFWEMSGDYDWHPDRNNGNGEYYIGYTLTNTLYDKFTNTTPYDNQLSNEPLPSETLDVNVEFTDFPLGDQNYPINPTMKVTNNSDLTIVGGSTIEFDVPTSTSPIFGSWSGDQVEVISVGHHRDNNIGGLDGEFHRVRVTLPNWKSIDPGTTEDFDLVYYLPISGPINFTATINGESYRLVGR